LIDYHSHILPEIDDGARDLAESVEMARLLAGSGFSQVFCTPHCIRGYYDTSAEAVREAVCALQKALDGEGIRLRLRPGMEYYLDEYFLDLLELQTLGESRLVLVEAPSQALEEVVMQGIEKVRAIGLTPLVAHPERSEVFTFPPSGLRSLPEGTLLQANLGSFTGFYGKQVQRRAYDLLRAGRYAALGSDAHDAERLAGMLEAWLGKLVANPALRLLAGIAGDGGGQSGEWRELALV
jgi:protein-tyrosine phosphatase